MKLRDNPQASVEACGVWGEVCPRRSRPPRIGDIPKHSAVDEESPGAESRKLASSPAEVSKSMLERLSSHGAGVYSPKTSPIRKSTPPSPIPDASARTVHKTSSSVHDTIRVPVDLLRTSSNPSGHPESSDLEETTRRSLCFEGNSSDDARNLIRLSSSSSREICEVRKDSALYLEEVEGLQGLKEILRSRSPKSLIPRRESSGYASSLGTFDEDRRNSDVDFGVLRERRRSSAKRLTSETFQPRRTSSKGEEFLHVRDETMPTMEVHRKVSSSGLDMPDIQEFQDAEYQETFGLEPRCLGCDDRDAIAPMPRNVGLTAHKFPNAPSTFVRTDSTNTNNVPASCRADQRNNIRMSRTSDVSVTNDIMTLTLNEDSPAYGPGLTYAEVLSKSGISRSNDPKTLSRAKSFDGESPINLPQAFSPISGKMRQRKSMVHQYSTPNFSTMELESISEKPSEKSPDNDKDSSPVGEQLMKRPAKDPDEGRKTTSVTIPDVEVTSKETELYEPEMDAKKLLPRSIKVYQLLSTQSEDRGDGVPNLDRRISLQIAKQDDEPIAVPTSQTDERKLLHAESVPTLTVPGLTESGTNYLSPTTAGCLPVRKLSSPGEIGASQRLAADSGLVGARPIYPYCPYSPYGSPQGSPRTRRRPLRESRRVSIDNRQGALQLNQYKLLKNIGQGSYGIVKLAYNEEDETHYAMKILSKKKLMKKAGIFGRMAPGRKGASNPLAKVYREIALLKKLDHPNVVKLVEVLDDPDEDNLYLVFELVQKGEVLQLPTDKPLDEETARTYFRDIVLGVEYLHYQRIVHRDIKPSNLLVDSEGRVKVADLGVSAELRASGELLLGPAGTPAFAAPETTTPGAQYSGTLCDVWSMGVTLYSLVTGRVPWDGAGSIIGVHAAVRSESLKFPDKPEVSEPLRDLISKMLAKEPVSRLALSEIKKHPWLTKNGSEILPSEIENCRLPVTVTDEEVARVVTRVPKLDTLILIKTMLKQHSFQNPFLPRRNAKSLRGSDAIPKESLSSSTSQSSGTSESTDSRTEKFHKAGRSNSAPDSYEWHPNDRQVSMESPLSPVTEALHHEIEAEKRLAHHAK